MKLMIDIGIGFSIFVLAMITWAVLPLDNLGFLFSGIPVFLITVVFALAARVRGRREGVRRGVIWASVFAVFVLIMVIGNQAFYVFGSFVYVPVAATALAPIVVGLIRRPAQPVTARHAPDTVARLT